ncbi:hypothetical protein DM02DRAFT_650049 [Periconia macrospinosa]|uniref:F-box domain-containing protein n=1 Tax=Periconia macrospinosa TaxID=97972 RepID=A0A2V1E9X5_9PLEO|nr:hypothetical protein DM02DRAFT_650049 [Periconia macrospinosa]
MGNEPSILFSLPFEIRGHIYNEVLAQTSETPTLLQTCRRIYIESQKYLFRRPLKFSSQSNLYQWFHKAPQEFLPEITEISLELQDVDLTPLLFRSGSPSVRQSDTGASLHIWDIYGQEIGRLEAALRALPNVTKITLRVVSDQQSHLYDYFLENVLRELVSIYPHLESLHFEGRVPRRCFKLLPLFRSLSSLSFDTYLASKPVETAQILSNLHLTDLSLISQSTVSAAAHHQHNAHTPELPFAVTFLNALTSQTLSSLCILQSHTPNSEFLDTLQDFMIRNTSMRRLELDWPNLDPGIIRRYTSQDSTLKYLWIRAVNIVCAFDIFRIIEEERRCGKIGNLEELVVLRDTWQDDTRIHAMKCVPDSAHTKESVPTDVEMLNLDFAENRLRALGLRVAWCTKTP